MRKGQRYNWWLRGGKGDPPSTGKLIAIAEWNEMNARLIADESGIKVQLGIQNDGSFKVMSDDIFDEPGNLNDGTAVENYSSKEQYDRVMRRQIYRDD